MAMHRAPVSGEAAGIREQVLRGLSANRVPGFHFPGHFLELRRTAIAHDGVAIEVADGAHLRGARGEVSMSVLALLADTALSAAIRLNMDAGVRLATVHLHIQLTGLPASGHLVAQAHPRESGLASGRRYLMGATTISSPRGVICHAAGDFMRLAPPPGVKLSPLPWERPATDPATPLGEDELVEHERSVLASADQALASAGTEPFIERFWTGERAKPAAERAAQRQLAVGPHVTNRVGHVQGGILLGLAAVTARDALPASMRLANVSSWFLRPGQGTRLFAHSQVVHAGRTMALVRTAVTGEDGSVALEAVTQHVSEPADIRGG